MAHRLARTQGSILIIYANPLSFPIYPQSFRSCHYGKAKGLQAKLLYDFTTVRWALHQHRGTSVIAFVIHYLAASILKPEGHAPVTLPLTTTGQIPKWSSMPGQSIPLGPDATSNLRERTETSLHEQLGTLRTLYSFPFAYEVHYTCPQCVKPNFLATFFD